MTFDFSLSRTDRNQQPISTHQLVAADSGSQRMEPIDPPTEDTAPIATIDIRPASIAYSIKSCPQSLRRWRRVNDRQIHRYRAMCMVSPLASALRQRPCHARDIAGDDTSQCAESQADQRRPRSEFLRRRLPWTNLDTTRPSFSLLICMWMLGAACSHTETFP